MNVGVYPPPPSICELTHAPSTPDPVLVLIVMGFDARWLISKDHDASCLSERLGPTCFQLWYLVPSNTSLFSAVGAVIQAGRDNILHRRGLRCVCIGLQYKHDVLVL